MPSKTLSSHFTRDVQLVVLTPMYNWLFQLFGEASVIFLGISSKICSSQQRKRFSRKFMPSSLLFPLPDGLEITAVSETPEEVLVHVSSYRASSPCPRCSMPSSAIHSSYRRHPKDLPCARRPCRVVFTVTMSFCVNP